MKSKQRLAELNEKAVTIATAIRFNRACYSRLERPRSVSVVTTFHLAEVAAMLPSTVFAVPLPPSKFSVSLSAPPFALAVPVVILDGLHIAECGLHGLDRNGLG